MGRRARMLGVYVKASTANPTGWRPWNSRLSGAGFGLAFYIPNSFPLPTTSGAFAGARRSANGGLAGVSFPNFASFAGDRAWRTQVNPATPQPVYGPPPSVRAQLSYLGAALRAIGPSRFREQPPVIVASGPVSAAPSTSSTWQSGRQRRQRGSQSQASNYEGWSAQQQGPQSWQQYQQQQAQQQAQTGSMTGSTSGGIVGYDASGNPIYSTPPAGLVVTGTDAQGNPVYGASGSTASTTAAASGSSFLTEDSLGLGLPNIAYAAIGVGLVLVLKRR